MKKRIILALAVLIIILGSIGLWLALRGRETTQEGTETTTEGGSQGNDTGIDHDSMMLMCWWVVLCYMSAIMATQVF